VSNSVLLALKSKLILMISKSVHITHNRVTSGKINIWFFASTWTKAVFHPKSFKILCILMATLFCLTKNSRGGSSFINNHLAHALPGASISLGSPGSHAGEACYWILPRSEDTHPVSASITQTSTVRCQRLSFLNLIFANFVYYL
jgi:hypothetical protein